MEPAGCQQARTGGIGCESGPRCALPQRRPAGRPPGHAGAPAQVLGADGALRACACGGALGGPRHRAGDASAARGADSCGSAWRAACAWRRWRRAAWTHGTRRLPRCWARRPRCWRSARAAAATRWCPTCARACCPRCRCRRTCRRAPRGPGGIPCWRQMRCWDGAPAGARAPCRSPQQRLPPRARLPAVRADGYLLRVGGRTAPDAPAHAAAAGGAAAGRGRAGRARAARQPARAGARIAGRAAQLARAQQRRGGCAPGARGHAQRLRRQRRHGLLSAGPPARRQVWQAWRGHWRGGRVLLESGARRGGCGVRPVVGRQVSAGRCRAEAAFCRRLAVPLLVATRSGLQEDLAGTGLQFVPAV